MMLGIAFTPVFKMLKDFPWEVVPIVMLGIMALVGVLWGSLWLMGIRHLSDIMIPMDEEDRECRRMCVLWGSGS